jgi:hypothetical protein
MFIDIAGAAAESYVDNKLVSQQVTERFKHVDSPESMRYWPAGTLSLVEVDGEDKTSEYVELWETGVYWVLKELNASPKCWTQFDITYTAGYDPLPADVAYAIAGGAIGYDTGAVGAAPVRKETIVGVGALEYDTALAQSTSFGQLPAASIAVLERYRRHHV